MLNLRMKEMLEAGEAKDVSVYALSDGTYKLPEGFFVEDVDYCDAHEEAWIWSIGRNEKTGEVFAARDTRYYERTGYECLWLR